MQPPKLVQRHTGERRVRTLRENAAPEPNGSPEILPEVGYPITIILCANWKLAVEAEATAREHPPQAQIQLEERDATFDCIRGVIEVLTTLAHQCSDTDKWVHERFSTLDISVNCLVGETATVQKRLSALATLEIELKMVTAQNERTAASIADLSGQLLHLQTTLANWQADSSNKALQNKVDTLAARVLALESRIDGFSDIKSDARRANMALSTMAEDVESLFGQLAMVSKQANLTAARLEMFRRHLDQFPD